MAQIEKTRKEVRPFAIFLLAFAGASVLMTVMAPGLFRFLPFGDPEPTKFDIAMIAVVSVAGVALLLYSLTTPVKRGRYVHIFPITTDQDLKVDDITVRNGDRLELFRDDPEKFFEARIVREDRTVIPTTLEHAQLLFRNGALCRRQ